MTHLEKLAATFAAMKSSLLAWAISRGGVKDREGCMSGLSHNDAIHFEIRNQQLATISDYSQACESLMSEQNMLIDRLRGEIRLLTTASREQMRSDDEVLKTIQILRGYEIGEETTLNDFEGSLRDTIYFFELGLKRGLIDRTDLIDSKLDWAKWFLKDQREMKLFFNHKKNKLYSIHGSIKTIIPTPIKP